MTYVMCNIYAMRRTTIFVDEKVLRQAQRVARRQGMSFATLVREALARYLAHPETGAALPAIAGRFSSARHDTAERVDELLWRDPHR